MRFTIFGAFLGVLTSALAASDPYPAIVGVDLVFPRRNDVYKRTSPFPVVLALHGAPATWPAGLSIKLELMRAERGEPAEPYETVLVNATDVAGRIPEDDGTYFVVVGMLEAKDSTKEDNFLQYTVDFPMECEDGGEAALRLADDTDLEYANHVLSSFHFSLNDEDGVEPDVVPRAELSKNEACPYHVNTLLIEGKESDECLLLGTPDYESINKECRTKIPEGFEGEVKAKLEEIKKCSDEKDGDDLSELCNKKPFLADNGEDEDSGSESGGENDGGSDESDEEDGDDSGARSLKADILGAAGLTALLVPILVSTL